MVGLARFKPSLSKGRVGRMEYVEYFVSGGTRTELPSPNAKVASSAPIEKSVVQNPIVVDKLIAKFREESAERTAKLSTTFKEERSERIEKPLAVLKREASERTKELLTIFKKDTSERSEKPLSIFKNDVSRLSVHADTGTEEAAEGEHVSLQIRLLRWLFPDVNRRRSKRISVPGLVAYYWTGGAPYSYEVGDVSATGVYLRTKERWAPGTTIQMTLQKQDGSGNSSDGSICVLSEVVRWGKDGAGFNFVLSDYDDAASRQIVPGEATSRKAVEKFLNRLEPSMSR